MRLYSMPTAGATCCRCCAWRTATPPPFLPLRSGGRWPSGRKGALLVAAARLKSRPISPFGQLPPLRRGSEKRRFGARGSQARLRRSNPRTPRRAQRRARGRGSARTRALAAARIPESAGAGEARAGRPRYERDAGRRNRERKARGRKAAAMAEGCGGPGTRRGRGAGRLGGTAFHRRDCRAFQRARPVEETPAVAARHARRARARARTRGALQRCVTVIFRCAALAPLPSLRERSTRNARPERGASVSLRSQFPQLPALRLLLTVM